MDDAGEGRQILREAAAAGRFEGHLEAAAFLQPAGDLYRADVLALAVMGAAFGDQHPVAGPQPVQGGDAAHGRVQKALIAGHEDGKRSKRDIRRRGLGHRAEGLGIGDDHGRPVLQGGQRRGEPVLLHHQGGGARLQHVADHLLRGQDEPSFRGGGVDGRDQDHGLAPLQQVAYQTQLQLVRGREPGHAFFQLVYAGAGEGADVDIVPFRVGGGQGLQQIAFDFDESNGLKRRALEALEEIYEILPIHPQFVSDEDVDGFIDKCIEIIDRFKSDTKTDVGSQSRPTFGLIGH